MRCLQANQHRPPLVDSYKADYEAEARGLVVRVPKTTQLSSMSRAQPAVTSHLWSSWTSLGSKRSCCFHMRCGQTEPAQGPW